MSLGGQQRQTDPDTVSISLFYTVGIETGSSGSLYPHRYWLPPHQRSPHHPIPIRHPLGLRQCLRHCPLHPKMRSTHLCP